MNGPVVAMRCAAALALAIAGGGRLGAEDPGWPQWRGPNGDGVSHETDWNPAALTGGPRILWKAKVGTGYSSVATKGDRVYTIGSLDAAFRVFCLDANTGRSVWQYADRKGGIQDALSTPTLSDDSVYALTSAGLLYCVDARSGRLRWKSDLVADCGAVKPFYSFAGSPVVEGDLVILTANSHGLALNRKTGRKVWVSEQPPKPSSGSSTGTAYSTPVMYTRNGVRHALIRSHEGLHSVVAATGALAWTFKWETPAVHSVADPLVLDGKLLATEFFSVDIECVLLDITGPQPRVLWKNANLCSDISTGVAIDGYFYGCNGGPEGGHGAQLCCLELATGKVMWSKPIESAGRKNVTLTAADGKLIVLEGSGTLRIARATPTAYDEISSCELPKEPSVFGSAAVMWTPPVLYRGRIYCRSMTGDLFCIDVRR